MVESLNARVMIDARYINGRESGIGRYTEHLVRELLRLDEGLRLRLITHPGCPRPVESDRVECQVFGAEANSLRTRFILPRRVDFSGVDLFHSPFNVLPAGLPVPAVFTLHDIMWMLDPWLCTDVVWRRWVTGTFYRSFIPRSVGEAARILTVSECSRRDIEAYFPGARGRVRVAANGLDPVFRPVEEEEAWGRLSGVVRRGTPFVLIVGQGAPYKNHVGAVRGFLEAFGDRQEVELVLVRRLERGGGELRELLSREELRGRVKVLEYLELETLQALYSMAFAFLFPSRYEGFGLPALEAMASGTAVVTSDGGAPAEVCGEGAVRVDPEDAAGIGRALLRLYEDEEFRGEMERRGLERARSFTWERCAREVLQVYEEVLVGGGKCRAQGATK